MRDLGNPPVDALSSLEDSVLRRQNDLNKEMLRLPLNERRLRWAEYCKRLSDLHSTHTPLSTARDAAGMNGLP